MTTGFHDQRYELVRTEPYLASLFPPVVTIPPAPAPARARRRARTTRPSLRSMAGQLGRQTCSRGPHRPERWRSVDRLEGGCASGGEVCAGC